MSPLDHPIQHARRRATLNLFVEHATLGFLAAAALWALTILIVRVFGLRLAVWPVGGATALLALLFAAVATLRARPTPLRAAVVLDAAAGLKERLSTAWAVRGSADPFAQAVVRDAERIASRLHVPAHIRYRAPALWPWSAAAMLSALLLAWLMPPLNVLARSTAAEPRVPRAEVEAEHQAIKTEFEQKLGRIRELARENPALDELLRDVEPPALPPEPTASPDDIRRKAVQKIDDVRERLRKQLEQGGEEALRAARRAFNRLNEPGQKAQNDRLSRALASGDFAGAKQALQDLAQEIQQAAQNAKDPEAQQKLAQMQEQLQRLAERLNELSDTVHLQKELEKRAGLTPEEARKLLNDLSGVDPKQLEKELQKRLGDKGLTARQMEELTQKLRQQQQARETCQKLSEALSKAAQACQRCQSGSGAAGEAAAEAANALSDAASQLSDLELSEQLLNELQAQISELENLRDDVCSGRMCRRRGGIQPGEIGEQGPQLGLGIGSRVGREKTAYKTDPQKAKSRFEGGTVIGRMLVEGPQVRGQAAAQEFAAVVAEVREQLDAVEREEVPRQYQRVLREYFERLAGVMRASSERSSPTPAQAAEKP